MKRGHQIRLGKISRGLHFLYIASSATRLSTHITTLVDNVFLALPPLLLFVKHYHISTKAYFISITF